MSVPLFRNIFGGFDLIQRLKLSEHLALTATVTGYINTNWVYKLQTQIHLVFMLDHVNYKSGVN